MSDEMRARGMPCPFCGAELRDGFAAPPVCPACGRSLLLCGTYRLRELLGRGGMGLVYGATVDPGGQRVAVKVLAPVAQGGWTAWDLFERSAVVLGALSHPRLPRVHAFARVEPLRLVLVREIFDGGTLAERFLRGKPLPPARVRQLLVSLLELLAYLEAQAPPVIHRDIKPANIMFRTPGDWDPVLVDFDTVSAPSGTGLTIVGTPGYTAPEQFAGVATPASDLYSLGATMLSVATGLDADEIPRRRDGRFNPGERLRPLDRDVREVILQLVEPDLDRRCHCAAEALALLASGLCIRPPSQRAAGLMAGAVALVVVTGLFAMDLWGHAPTSRLDHYGSNLVGEIERLGFDCDGGESNACFSLAVRHDLGHGVPRDLARALGLYSRGCDGGHAASCMNLGLLYLEGRGVPRDDERGVALLRSACQSGDADGCHQLELAAEQRR